LADLSKKNGSLSWVLLFDLSRKNLLNSALESSKLEKISSQNIGFYDIFAQLNSFPKNVARSPQLLLINFFFSPLTLSRSQNQSRKCDDIDVNGLPIVMKTLILYQIHSVDVAKLAEFSIKK
jgi:hypothetical protein